MTKPRVRRQRGQLLLDLGDGGVRLRGAVGVDQRRDGLHAVVGGLDDLRRLGPLLDVDDVERDLLPVELALEAVAVATPRSGVHGETRVRSGVARGHLGVSPPASRVIVERVVPVKPI